MAKRTIWCAVGVLLLLWGCKPRGNEPTATDTSGKPPNEYSEQATAQVRDSIREVTDVMFKEAAAANEVKKDAAVTDAIRQYEAMAPEDRVKYVIENKAAIGAVSGAMPNPDDPLVCPQRIYYLLMAGHPEERPNIDFNLAVARTDVVAKQIRMTNDLFGDVDAKAMSALEAYEKMTPQQKQAFIATPNAQSYYWYWQYMYFWQKVWLLRYYRIYTAQTEWGYKQPIAMEKNATLDREFDLKTTAAR